MASKSKTEIFLDDRKIFSGAHCENWNIVLLGISTNPHIGL